jgi:uncharacterized protein (AIM24 family)
MQKILAPREVITVDAACIVAMTNTINIQLKSPNQLRRAVFGVRRSFSSFTCFTSPYLLFRFSSSYFTCTEMCHLMHGDNQLTASLTGPGVVFIQSLPFHKLSQRIATYDDVTHLLHSDMSLGHI